MARVNAFVDGLRASLWFVPAIFATVAVVGALVLDGVDRSLHDDGTTAFFLFGGSPDGARSVLSAIAQSMLTFTGLVFTVTMLVLQLASNQLSPRVMRTFLRDRGNQVVLGLFVATFVYTLLVLREVRGGADPFVPALSVWVSFVLLLSSVAAFIYYIDHMAHAIRASTVITNIWRESTAAIDRLFPERVGRDASEVDATPPDWGEPSIIVKSAGAGILVGVDEAKLLEAVDGGDRRLELVPAVGDFVAEGAPLARLWGTWDSSRSDLVHDAIALGVERTLAQDAAFGIRQLVDIAVRALSPGTNDPTTAVQALDRIHDLLRRLAVREFPSTIRYDDQGRARLRVRRPGWDDHVRLGIDEIRLSGEDQLQVHRRLRALIEDLSSVAPPERQAILEGELARIVRGADRGLDDPDDRDAALEPSLRGHSLRARIDHR
jgi:uncharacterized membrane protein